MLLVFILHSCEEPCDYAFEEKEPFQYYLKIANETDSRIHYFDILTYSGGYHAPNSQTDSWIEPRQVIQGNYTRKIIVPSMCPDTYYDGGTFQSHSIHWRANDYPAIELIREGEGISYSSNLTSRSYYFRYKQQ